jgi:hypothetical protein
MPKRNKDNEKNIKRKKKFSDEMSLIEDDFLEIEEEADIVPVIEEVEDNKEFLTQVRQFEKKHKNSKLVNISQLIGNSEIKDLKKVRGEQLKEEYDNLILLLDRYDIIVHFQNDYSIEEKYRFITEEIFKQDVEKSKHISFIYEDFHPEMIDPDEEEEI